jgi:imidazoleglycerol-phosphate dehydratase
MSKRISLINRTTKETSIRLKLGLDGHGIYHIKTPIPFLTHMLEVFSKHSCFDLEIQAAGDIEVDDHHTVEDLGICLGTALNDALGSKMNISRFGYAYIPLDEALVRTVIDLSGRSYMNFLLNLNTKKRIGTFDTELIEDFFKAVCENGKMNLHLEMIHGRNSHHIVEAAFKSFARALKMAVGRDVSIKGIPSTKGQL